MTRNDKLNAFKIESLRRRGINVFECTSSEWLDLAIQSEGYALANVVDPAASHFFRQAQIYMTAAELRENAA